MSEPKRRIASPPRQPHHLIILLGYRNHPNGELFEATKARCQLALAQALKYPEALILPTGAFGENFNRSPRAHGLWLTDYLVDHGLHPDRILAFTRTARTLEDALAVRKQAVDLGAAKLTVVTSAFHIDRCRFLFGRVLGDQAIEFVGADLPLSSPEETQAVSKNVEDEPAKLNGEMNDWLDLPLYGPSPSEKQFPEKVYQNASEEQRAYDQISYLLISAAFICFAGPYTLANSDRITFFSGLFLSIALIFSFFILYLRVASWAMTARRLMYLIESQWDVPGFSYQFLHGERPSNPKLPWLLRKLTGIGFRPTFMVVVLLLVLTQAASIALIAIRDHDSPARAESLPNASPPTKPKLPRLEAPSPSPSPSASYHQK